MSTITLRNRMKEFGVQRIKRIKIPKDKLEFLYIDSRYSMAKCAEKLNVTAMAIHKRLKKYSIPRRGHGDTLQLNLDKDKLIELYINNKWTVDKCAYFFQCDHKTVRINLIRYDIPIRGNSEKQMGILNNCWLGGISENFKKRLANRKWRKIVETVRERDNYICQECGEPGCNVHHIIPYRLTFNDGLDNLITLCKKCHATIERKICQCSR